MSLYERQKPSPRLSVNQLSPENYPYPNIVESAAAMLIDLLRFSPEVIRKHIKDCEFVCRDCWKRSEAAKKIMKRPESLAPEKRERLQRQRAIAIYYLHDGLTRGHDDPFEYPQKKSP